MPRRHVRIDSLSDFTGDQYIFSMSYIIMDGPALQLENITF